MIFGYFRVLKCSPGTPIWVLGNVSKMLKSTPENMGDGQKRDLFWPYPEASSIFLRCQAGFLYILGILPPPRFLSWLVLPHPVGAYHPWALVLVLSGFGSRPAAVGARSCNFVAAALMFHDSPRLEPFEALDAVGASVIFHKRSRYPIFHAAFFRVVGVSARALF